MLNRKICLTGVSDSRSAKVISESIEKGKQCLIIVSGHRRAEKLAMDFSFFSERKVYILPEDGHIFLDYSARNRDQDFARLKVIKALATEDEAVVIAPVSAAIKKMPPHRSYQNLNFSLKLGQEIEVDELKRKLAELGYERNDIVATQGQFSIRGGIVDFYPPDADEPVRIEFFGSEIDSIRSFDIETQRSIDNLKNIDIYPSKQLTPSDELIVKATETVKSLFDKQIAKLSNDEEKEDAANCLTEKKNELIEYISEFDNDSVLENYVHYFYPETEYIWDYMGDAMIVYEDFPRIEEHLELRSEELKNDLFTMLERGKAIPEDSQLITGMDDLQKSFGIMPEIFMFPFGLTGKVKIDFDEIRNIECRQMTSYAGHLDVLENDLKRIADGKNRVVISASSDERQQTIDDFVANIGLADKIQVVQGSLSMGMVFPEEKLYIISDKDIFNSTRIGKKRHKTNRSQKMQSFSDFKTGDYVVHENHGIGKFLGIQALEVQGEQKDYLKIKYSGTDLLYVPVEQMDIVQKYIGSEGIAPKVSKLSGDEWKVAKTRAKLAIAEMTEELIKLYADRKASKGYAFSKDTVWQKEFEAYFSYQETDDQLTSIEEIKKDMESNLPMDRLLCGDVGYGKTEVAARAIFKCISEGKQAAMLVPTTILANQHYNSLKDRFSNFPFNIDMLSRFRTDKQQEKIIDGLKKGSVDFVIGTHRLLSDDIKYKDLGLLVIDEEQRFGVAHKEKLKQLKSNIDVLTLSATPIPRTLNMSLTGIKDMSLITEPPSDRYPVQTYVLEQDDIVMREIIARELDRDGQVYIVFNRVKGINRLAEKVQSLVPDAKIVVGHGQMNEKSLESVMQTFISGKADILIATTIIESGIDIPNANTMIVIDADKCGLAQLYQLRGRVGRTDKIAYAYLMYQKNKVLTEVAEKRLKAIKEFTEFGSGFKVAMRDLEIRGAGNVLGAEQSGHMMNIGYELYCKLVDDAVRKAKGESVPEQVDEINIELDVAANIPNWYIDNETLKLQMYKKIATVSTREDSEEIIDELLDRFGDLPKETLNLIAISMIRALSANVGVCNIHEQAGKVVIYFAQDNALKAYALMKASEKFGSKIFFHGGNEPFIRLSVARKERLDSIIDLLEIISDNKDIDNSGSKTVS